MHTALAYASKLQIAGYTPTASDKHLDFHAYVSIPSKNKQKGCSNENKTQKHSEYLELYTHSYNSTSYIRSYNLTITLCGIDVRMVINLQIIRFCFSAFFIPTSLSKEIFVSCYVCIQVTCIINKPRYPQRWYNCLMNTKPTDVLLVQTVTSS